MSETLRETIENAFKYYQWLEAESDRGVAVLAVALFEEQLMVFPPERTE